jgi:RNA polymerase sigma-B factor
VSRDRRGSPGPAQDLRALIISYRQDPSPERQAELAGRLLPLVGQVAQRYAGLGTPLDDLVQVGSIGLLNAIANFDVDRGVRFETYARHLIAGEIRHYLRDQGSVVRRPRWFHELDHRVRQTATILTQRLGRFPLVPEIAEELGIPVQWVLQAARTRESFRFMSLDEVREDGDGTPVTPYDRLSGEQLSGQISSEDRVLLADAVDRLSAMQRKVIYCLFYLDLTQTEAAQHLGISQKHVSRMMHAAVRRLREALHPGTVDGHRTKRTAAVAAE